MTSVENKEVEPVETVQINKSYYKINHWLKHKYYYIKKKHAVVNNTGEFCWLTESNEKKELTKESNEKKELKS